MSPAPSIRPLPRAVVGLFFGLLLGLGGWLVGDYGVSWDEATNRTTGMVNVRYLAELVAPAWAARQPRRDQVPRLATYTNNDHGALFELPIAGLDAVLRTLHPATPPRTYYLLRHGAVFLLSLAGLWALFRLGARRFADERWGLLAAALLVLSPRLFAESFYNGKDVVFMALFTLAVLALVRLLERPGVRRALVLALATAAATDVRVLGLLLAAFTLGLLTLNYGLLPARRPALRRAALAYVPATAAAIVAGWPYLWAHPLHNLLAAFHSLGHYQRWSGDVLYWGRILAPAALPWHYAPVWISLTTPVAYQLAALGGLGLVAAGLLRQPLARLRTLAGQLDLLLLGWLLLPLFLVIGLHSVIYDGWRHLYFIYPALLLLAVHGARAVARLGHRGAGGRRLALGLGLLAGAEALLTAGRMVRMHPHQQTYFSYLPRALVAPLFERDYWALSFRQGLEYVVARQPTGPILVETEFELPYLNNLVWLAPAGRARLVLAPGAPGRYFITTYRTRGVPYPARVGREVFAVRADGVKIMSVFRLAPGPTQ